MSCGIYIHIPFCEKKCPYCDFYSVKYSKEYAEKLTQAVIKVIKSDMYRSVSADTIYFGGGTPNLLGAKNICKITDVLFSTCNISDKCEITMEANPESLCRQNIKDFHLSGVNRLSLGLQSADESELTTLGRRHTLSEVSKCIDSARKNSINNISLDIMLALEGQTPEKIKKTVSFCKQSEVTHVSSYLLKIEEGTRFFNKRSSLLLPDDDGAALLYEKACEYLEDAGFYQYEISNFSKPGYKSRHNLKYWNCESYAAIGPAAYGFMNGKRFHYPRSICQFIEKPFDTVSDGDGGTAEEYLMLALRLSKGLDLSMFEKKFSLRPSKKFMSMVSRLCSRKLMQKSYNIISLTRHGFLVSNTIISDLLLAQGL